MAIAIEDLEESFRRLQVLHSDMSGQADGSSPRKPFLRLSRAALEPVLADFGITRVGQLTELDDLDIPVWAAMRPASRSLSVSAGKGTTDEAAWTSAVMESCEQAMAEDFAALVVLVETPRGLARRGLRSVPLELQSRCAAAHLDPDHEMAWARGLSWRSGETVYAPFELVGMDMLASAPWDVDLFRMTSVGLASGAELAGAIAHGLCELIEDDALFAALLPRAGAENGTACFDANRVPGLLQTVERLAAKGVEARFADIGSDGGLPVIAAALVPQHGPRTGQAYFTGVASDAIREEAALGALLEAVQCRAIFVSGARDDLYENEYKMRLTDATRALFGACRFDVLPASASSQGPVLGSIADAVHAMTGGDFYVFPLGGTSHGFEAVRVLADDLVSTDVPVAYARTGRAALQLLNKWSRP